LDPFDALFVTQGSSELNPRVRRRVEYELKNSVMFPETHDVATKISQNFFTSGSPVEKFNTNDFILA